MLTLVLAATCAAWCRTRQQPAPAHSVRDGLSVLHLCHLPYDKQGCGAATSVFTRANMVSNCLPLLSSPHACEPQRSLFLKPAAMTQFSLALLAPG